MNTDIVKRKTIPILTPATEKYFVDKNKLEPTAIHADGAIFLTSAFQTGCELNLFSFTPAPFPVNSYNQLNIVDSNIGLRSIFVELGDKVIEVDVEDQAFSNFTFDPSSLTPEYPGQLNLRLDFKTQFEITKNTKCVDVEHKGQSFFSEETRPDEKIIITILLSGKACVDKHTVKISQDYITRSLGPAEQINMNVIGYKLNYRIDSTTFGTGLPSQYKS